MIKVLVTVICLFASINAFAQNAFFSEKIKLNDSDSYVAPVYISDYQSLNKDSMIYSIMTNHQMANPYQFFKKLNNEETQIADNITKKLLASPLLSSLGIREISTSIQNAVENNCHGAYNDKRINPVIWSVSLPYNKKTNEFLHKIIKIKKVRDYVVTIFTDLLVELCKIYPQDYKQHIIKEMKNLINFIDDMPKHSYEAVDLRGGQGGKTLYVDGKLNEYLARDSRGFIVRRYLYDEIPLAELKSYINKVISAINLTDVSKNPNVLLRIDINNNASYVISSEGNYYHIGNTNYIYPYDLEYWKGYRTTYGYTPLENGRSRIKCSSDGQNTIYTIEAGNISASNKKYDYIWETGTGIYKGMIIVESNGDIILKDYKEKKEVEHAERSVL